MTPFLRLTLFTSIIGRINRLEFILMLGKLILEIFLLMVLYTIVMDTLRNIEGNFYMSYSKEQTIKYIFNLVTMLLFLYGFFVIQLKRLKDIGVSIWLCVGYFLLLFIPIINIFVLIIGLLYMLFMPGSNGKNKYGLPSSFSWKKSSGRQKENTITEKRNAP